MIWLLVWAALTRLPYLLSQTLLFGFDQGRDALAVWNFIKTFNLPFIGAPTSIPGLFIGPGWYYFLAPAYWLFQGNPIGGAWLMFCLYLAAIILTYKFLGAMEAIIISLAPIWTQLATAAQSPYPIPLLAIILLIALKKNWHPFLIGIIVGLSFNFDSALAIFWLTLIPVLIKPKRWLWFLAGNIPAFIPQLLFELKHNFSQTRAVIAYFAAGESQQISLGKISTVNQSVMHELSLAVLPDNQELKIIGLAIILIGLVFLIKQKKIDFWRQILILTVVPVIGFWFLHYNPWYSYGLLPLAVIAVGKILRSLPKPIAWLFLLLLLINSTLKFFHFETIDKARLAQHKGFLTAKLQALDYIYTQAGDQSFTSYHYHPEIYDFAYQYLYIWQAFKGKPLPIEFSYQPGAPSYIPEKESLLKLLPSPDGRRDEPSKIFLIIEKPDNIWHYPLESWLRQINYSKVIDKKIIGPELEVWQVQPRSD